MSEGLKIALTAVGGIAVFVVGQIVQKWFIDPIQEQKKLVGEIIYSLIFYTNLPDYREGYHQISNVRFKGEKIEGSDPKHVDELYFRYQKTIDEGLNKLRELSSRVYPSIQLIPCYWILQTVGIVHKRKKLYEVAWKLQEWANNPDINTAHCQQRIIDLLNVKDLIRAEEQWEKQRTAPVKKASGQ